MKGEIVHVLKHHSVKAYREVKVNLHAFLTLKMEASDQLHAPAAFVVSKDFMVSVG